MEVAIHIGMQKTGSTSIQQGLVAIQGPLAERGVLYSTAFGPKKAKTIKRAILDSAAPEHTAFREELSGSWRTVIVSNENLFSPPREVMAALRDVVVEAGGVPRVYAYVRRPDDHLPSVYQQGVRSGEMTLSMDSYLDLKLSHSYYNYDDSLSLWSDVFGKDAVNVKLFHREILRGDPFKDFMAWIGLSTEAAELHPEEIKSRTSFDEAGVDVLRYFRRYQAERSASVDDRLLNNVRGRIRQLDSGKRLALPAQRAADLYAVLRERNAMLAEHFLTPKEAELFLPPPAPTGNGGSRLETYDVIDKTLAVIGDLAPVLREPDPAAQAASGDPGAIELDPVGGELLQALRRYRENHPDKLDERTLLQAERLLQQPGHAIDQAVDEPRFEVFSRLLQICRPLDLRRNRPKRG